MTVLCRLLVLSLLSHPCVSYAKQLFIWELASLLHALRAAEQPQRPQTSAPSPASQEGGGEEEKFYHDLCLDRDLLSFQLSVCACLCGVCI